MRSVIYSAVECAHDRTVADRCIRLLRRFERRIRRHEHIDGEHEIGPVRFRHCGGSARAEFFLNRPDEGHGASELGGIECAHGLQERGAAEPVVHRPSGVTIAGELGQILADGDRIQQFDAERLDVCARSRSDVDENRRIGHRRRLAGREMDRFGRNHAGHVAFVGVDEHQAALESTGPESAGRFDAQVSVGGDAGDVVADLVHVRDE